MAKSVQQLTNELNAKRNVSNLLSTEAALTSIAETLISILEEMQQQRK